MKKNNYIDIVVKLAEKEMKELNHPYVGSEHLILALLKNDEIKEICDDYDLTYKLFKQELINIIGLSNIETKKILHTPLLKSILKSAIKDAKENNDGLVTPKHLFISILESGDGIGVRILLSLNVDLEGIYKDLKRDYNPLLSDLKKYGKDLSVNDTILVNRDNEIENIIEILLRKNKNNPLLVGDSGVGKTAIIEGLATLIKNNKIKDLKGYKVYTLDMSLLISGSKYRGDFEERLNNVIKEVLKDKKTILFIDEIHTIINAGGSEGAIDAANILKPYLSRGEIKIIGATTKEEYNKYFNKDKALIRRFDLIEITEPNEIMTKDILYKIKNNYKNYHNINITKSNLDMILDYSNKYILDKKNPDKVLDVLDSVCSYVKNKKRKNIIKEDIENIISRKINRKLNLDNDVIFTKIANKVYGQDNSIKKILNIIKNNNNFKSILLLGGIGVGKTTSIKNISKELSINFINIDMGEYSNIYSLNNIYNGENSLYNKLNNNSFILFDNIEKCNKTVINIIIKIIEERKIKDKELNNSTIFLSATNEIKYGIGFNNNINKINYNNKDIIDKVDYIVKYDEIKEDSIAKYIKENNIKDFDYTKCDYKTYGFRGIKISLNNETLTK